jgi:hypothetical protein
MRAIIFNNKESFAHSLASIRGFGYLSEIPTPLGKGEYYTVISQEDIEQIEKVINIFSLLEANEKATKEVKKLYHTIVKYKKALIDFQLAYGDDSFNSK